MIPLQKTTQKTEKLEQTTLGFEEDSKLRIFTSSAKRKIKRFNQEMKYSGIYHNFWLWNMVFLHAAVATLLGFLVYKYFDQLPQTIGITVDNTQRFDSLISKNIVYVLVVYHTLCALFTLGFGIKAEKRLNHLLIASFFNFLVLSFYEFYALRDFVFYFN